MLSKQEVDAEEEKNSLDRGGHDPCSDAALAVTALEHTGSGSSVGWWRYFIYCIAEKFRGRKFAICVWIVRVCV